MNANKKEVQSRAHNAMTLLNFVSAAEKDQSEDNTKILITEMMRQYPGIFSNAAQEAGISSSMMITPHAAVDLQSLLRIPDNKMRNLRACLKKVGAHVIPSARQMTKVKKEKIAHVKDD